MFRSAVAFTLFVGPLMAVLATRALAAPPNDACGAATVITAPPFSDAVDTTDPTWGPEDPSPCNNCYSFNNSHSVWYVFSSPTPVHVSVTTASSDYPTYVAVYTGTCAAESPVACGYSSPYYPANGSPPGQTTFLACPGTSYLIEISGPCGYAGGHLALSVTTTPADLDDDGDGVDVCADNCPHRSNPGQDDTDGDGIGDACEATNDACSDATPIDAVHGPRRPRRGTARRTAPFAATRRSGTPTRPRSRRGSGRTSSPPTPRTWACSKPLAVRQAPTPRV